MTHDGELSVRNLTIDAGTCRFATDTANLRPGDVRRVVDVATRASCIARVVALAESRLAQRSRSMCVGQIVG